MTNHHQTIAPVTVIGAGLAGVEAVARLSRAGVPVTLYEMRPGKSTPAHQTGLLAELVCSNSLKSDSIENATGLLKAEMEVLDSLVMRAARASAVPAGGALAVDRERFATLASREVESLAGVELVREELVEIPADGVVIVATGPLTSDALARSIGELTGTADLFFYDAIAPIVTLESVDRSVAFRASRYDKGGDDYLNCPLDRAEYESLVAALVAAEKTPLRAFEDPQFFEGCLPVEVMAARGVETLAHGPLKPVGLIDPRTGARPHAVVQLRQDNAAGTLYNLVGFQTRLTWPEQERVLRMIPGLGRAEFARLGSVHRNTFINSPRLLGPGLNLRSQPRLFFAGQITGVEGYAPSAAIGIIAGINAARAAVGLAPVVPPATTMIGALIAYATDPDRERFQPVSPNFGILEPLGQRMKKVERKAAYARRALEAIGDFSMALDTAR